MKYFFSNRLTSVVANIFSSRVWQEIRRFLSSFVTPWVSVVWVCVVAIPPVFLVAEIVSIQQEIMEPADSLLASRVKDALDTQLKYDPTIEMATGNRPLYSSLVAQRAIKVIARRSYDRVQYQYENVVTYRYDVIIVFTGLWLVLLYAIRTLGVTKSDYSTFDDSEKSTAYRKVSRPTDVHASLSGAIDNISVLKDEVHYARRRALDVHQRSSIMLLAGVVMAFVGVGAFYVSLPPVGPDTTLEAYLMQSLRPAGMLVFVEALAWFLLRQYRSLSEEYRRFHRLAQRRADFLTAFMTVDQANTPDAVVLVLTALLQEPTTLVLKNGESTEAIEESKSASANPIFDLANSVLLRVPLTNGKRNDG